MGMKTLYLCGAGNSEGVRLTLNINAAQARWDRIVILDDDPKKRGKRFSNARVLGDHSGMLEIAQKESVSDIIVSITGPMGGEMFQTLLDAQERGIEITRMPVAYEELLGRVPVQYLESDWLLRSFVDEVKVSGFYLLAKRVMDLLLLRLVIFVIRQ